MKQALISVYDKTHIVSFAKELVSLGYRILSSGGTYKALTQEGVKAVEVSEYTQSNEIFEGRVKTLHPKIHGGILMKTDSELHQAQAKDNVIEPIDLVVVNFYPFEETIQKAHVTLAESIENIDIGGPSMVRSAAKNFHRVTVLVDPEDYDPILAYLKRGEVPLELRQTLSAKAFAKTAYYDSLITHYLYPTQDFACLTMPLKKKTDLRYGENPHQEAALYAHPLSTFPSLLNAEILNGKALSYNNYQDADAAITILSEYEQPTCVAIKHMNPCGIGSASTIQEAYQKAYLADTVSIFGGIVAFNEEVDVAIANALHSLFLEVIIAPSFSEEALMVLSVKKNVRIIKLDVKPFSCRPHLKSIHGGILIQDCDAYVTKELTTVTQAKPDEALMQEMLFAYKAVKHVKSNAIVVSQNHQTLGIGAGQMNRVGAAKLALEQAKDKAMGTVLASDAFFPMDDTVKLAAQYGIKAIIQPGGSIKDVDSIKACDEAGIIMVFTEMRHFKH